MESHFGVCLANGPHCLPQPKVIKKKLDMVIDFAAIAYLFPYHDNLKIVLSILDGLSSVTFGYDEQCFCYLTG